MTLPKTSLSIELNAFCLQFAREHKYMLITAVSTNMESISLVGGFYWVGAGSTAQGSISFKTDATWRDSCVSDVVTWL